jgi:hypothetical protein
MEWRGVRIAAVLKDRTTVRTPERYLPRLFRNSFQPIRVQPTVPRFIGPHDTPPAASVQMRSMAARPRILQNTYENLWNASHHQGDDHCFA